MARIFISYKRVDKDKVFKIKDQIESALGEKCWIDLDGIESDAQFKHVIIHAINDCEVVLFMYSEAHSKIIDFEKDWTVKELNFAAKRNKRIVFLNIDGSPLTDDFEFDYGTQQQIDINSKGAMSKLVEDLASWLNVDNNNDKDDLHLLLSASTLYNEGLNAELKKLALDGNKFAQLYYGECFFTGRNVTASYRNAVEWYKLAAQQNLPEAQYKLGHCYENGQGVIQSYRDAVTWYKKAAEQGNAQAQCNLGICYLTGNGVRKSYKRAFEWLSRSADKEYAKAQCHLGVCYYNGYGVIANTEKALELLSKAYQNGDDLALDFMENIKKRQHK